MKPNYSVDKSVSEKEYVRFNRFLRYRNKKNMSIIIGSSLLITAFSIVQIYEYSDVALAVGFLAGLLVAIWMYTFGADRRARKYYNQFVLKEGTEQHIDFYDDHYEQFSAVGNVKIQYNQLFKIYVTKTNIYMMRSPSVGCALSLGNCSHEFVSFVKKIKEQYNI